MRALQFKTCNMFPIKNQSYATQPIMLIVLDTAVSSSTPLTILTNKCCDWVTTPSKQLLKTNTTDNNNKHNYNVKADSQCWKTSTGQYEMMRGVALKTKQDAKQYKTIWLPTIPQMSNQKAIEPLTNWKLNKTDDRNSLAIVATEQKQSKWSPPSK